MTRLRDLRLERGWSGAELGRRARVHPAEISGLELGRRVPPPDSVVLRRLARVLRWEGKPAALLEDAGNDTDA